MQSSVESCTSRAGSRRGGANETTARRAAGELAGDAPSPLGAATLAALFEARVARDDHAVALTHGEASLSYGALHARANRLAHYLIEAGVGPESLVGIALERSPYMIVALLAAAKAGAAYLPLDPSYPPARLTHMLVEAAPTVVLSTARLSQCLPMATIALDAPEMQARLDRMPAHDPTDDDRRAVLRPAHLAYVLYTSGSTGMPKGVAVTHAGIASCASAHAEGLAVAAGSRVLQFASLNFDASVAEIVTALSTGATLILVDQEQRGGPALAEVLASRRVSHAILPPVVLATLEDDDAPALEGLIVAGEACPGDLFARWSRGHRMLNAYGPTETTVCATMSTPGRAEGSSPPPIGRAIRETRVYVLDDRLEPAADGEIGELYVAGDSLARGYLARSGLTAAAFVPDPSALGTRMYRTGDLALRRAGGFLEFHGRADQQVKIRGVRIEPGEIEAVLATHPAVRACAVATDKGRADRLVAYLVTRSVAPSLRSLRQHLQKRLPDVMIPAAFVRLAALPLSPNGKVDRRALPAIATRQAATSLAPAAAYVPPRTPAEKILAGIWCQVLDLERVGVHDDFFELGGDSLRRSRAIHLARQAGLELPVTPRSEHQNIADLAAGAVAKKPGSAIDTSEGAREAFPLSSMQERFWSHYRAEAATVPSTVPGLFRLSGALDVTALERSLAVIVEHHHMLRTTFEDSNGEPIQRLTRPPNRALPMIDLGMLVPGEQEAAAKDFAASLARLPIDLERGPIFRVAVFRFSPREHVLLFITHHIAFDGSSLGVFVRELEALYPAFRSGQQPSSPTPRLQYRHFARWQRRTRQDEAHAAYWREQLRGVSGSLTFPGRGARRGPRSFRAATEVLTLSVDLSRRLRQLGHRQATTPFSVMLAAFDSLLYLATGQDDVTVGSFFSTRDRPELDDLIGIFVTNLPLRSRLTRTEPFSRLLARVHATVLEAQAHSHVLVEKILAEQGAISADRATQPFFRIMFLQQDLSAASGVEMHTAHDPGVASGLRLDFIPVETDRIKHDLTVAFGSDGDRLRTRWKFSVDLFEATARAAMIARYHRLLERIALNPELPIGDLLHGGETRPSRIRL